MTSKSKNKTSKVEKHGLITVFPPHDAIAFLKKQKERAQVVMLDPWYNKGVGGTRPDYHDWLEELVAVSARCADHVFLWGFPEIICKTLERLPENLSLLAWLTWYYKNCPTIVSGWRSSQYTCLHLASRDAKTYPEHFYNEVQLERLKQGKLRYKPGPPNVLEVPLNIGFVGRKEQTGHPAQKPEKVIEPLILMSTKPGDLVIDPFCGSGTTGAVCQKLGREAILCDISEEYLCLSRKRLASLNGVTHRNTTLENQKLLV